MIISTSLFVLYSVMSSGSPDLQKYRAAVTQYSQGKCKKAVPLALKLKDKGFFSAGTFLCSMDSNYCDQPTRLWKLNNVRSRTREGIMLVLKYAQVFGIGSSTQYYSAYKRSRPPKVRGLKILLEQANKGDSHAMYALGGLPRSEFKLALKNNLMVKDDRLRWLKLAADRNHTIAHLTLGRYYWMTRKNYTKFKVPFLFGDRKFRQNVAGFSKINRSGVRPFFIRKGLKIDYKKAEFHYKKAVMGGWIGAIKHLEYLKKAGHIQTIDYPAIFNLHLQRAKKGSVKSSYLVMLYYRKGIGVAKNRSASNYWYDVLKTHFLAKRLVKCKDYRPSQNFSQPTPIKMPLASARLIEKKPLLRIPEKSSLSHKGFPFYPNRVLNSAELKTLFLNKTVTGEHNKKGFTFKRYYSADGKVYAENSSKGKRTGRWRVSSNMMCISWKAENSRCRVIITRQGKSMQYNGKETRIAVDFNKFQQGNKL